MNKISKLRKTLLVFFIVSLSLIAAFAALYVLNPMFLNNNNPAMIGPTLDLGFRFISQSFVLPFTFFGCGLYNCTSDPRVRIRKKFLTDEGVLGFMKRLFIS